MATIPQRQLFSWKDFETKGDLERLELVINNLPDEKLVLAIESERANGRDDHPVRAMWNAFLAKFVYQHNSIESLRRELSRNPALFELCGFNILKFGDKDAVPSKSAFHRFHKGLKSKSDLVDEIFHSQVNFLSEYLPNFGAEIAFDSKAIDSLASSESKKFEGDDRRDLDACWAKKQYHGLNKDGTGWSKSIKWFGYKLHLIVDAHYELPIGYKVTKASKADKPAMELMFSELSVGHPSILQRCEYAMGDKAYDCQRFIKSLWDVYKIRPIIDIRKFKSDNETKHISDHHPLNVLHDHQGALHCYCPATGERTQMAFGGFEKDRNSLKYLCPAKNYGTSCKGMAKCAVNHSVRVKLDENRRKFTPLPRSSYKWKKLYNKRTSVERVNSRIGLGYGFDHHFIRGIKKMKLHSCLALNVMLAMAIGRIREKRPDLMRSLVKAA